jgi:hypothetical protein
VLELDRSRKHLVNRLVEVAVQGRRVLVHGPWGVGKTALLCEAARAARQAGILVGYRASTRRLEDVMAALEQAYGSATVDLPTTRQRRSSLRLACEIDRGVILLDGFRARGSALVGFLRSLRGKQLAVIAAVDVEHPRDLASARAGGVAYQEMAVPPLTGPALRRHLDQLIAVSPPPPFALGTEARRTVLRLSHGCPGVLGRIWARLGQARYWHEGAPLTEAIGADVRMEWLAEEGDVARLDGRRA